MKPLLKHNPRQPDLCSSVGIAIEINFENICTTRLCKHPMIVNAARATQVAVIAPLLHKIILQFPVPYCSLLSPLLKQNQKLNTSEWAGCSAEHTEVPCWKGKASTLKRAFQFIFSKPSALRILCSCWWKCEAFYPKGYRGKGGWHSQLTSPGCPHLTAVLGSGGEAGASCSSAHTAVCHLRHPAALHSPQGLSLHL